MHMSMSLGVSRLSDDNDPLFWNMTLVVQSYLQQTHKIMW